MDTLIELIITILCSVFASSGFWMYVQKSKEKHDSKTDLLLGLAHDRIIFLGMKYIERGWITQDEYENLNDYLYKPYKANNGNGSGDRVMEEVKKLPIKSSYRNI